jgi:hypothetical protein
LKRGWDFNEASTGVGSNDPGSARIGALVMQPRPEVPVAVPDLSTSLIAFVVAKQKRFMKKKVSTLN